jgi:translation initiation factor IF-1
MPRNLKGGNKAKSQKNSSCPTKERDIAIPDSSDDSHVAIITKVNGDFRYLCKIVNDEGVQEDNEYLANLSNGVRRNFARGIYIGCGTYILISIREYQKNKVDVIFVYKDSEVNYLINNNYISVNKNNNSNTDADINFVEFADSNETKNISLIETTDKTESDVLVV